MLLRDEFRCKARAKRHEKPLAVMGFGIDGGLSVVSRGLARRDSLGGTLGYGRGSRDDGLPGPTQVADLTQRKVVISGPRSGCFLNQSPVGYPTKV